VSEHRGTEWGSDRSYGVAGLLYEDLGESDHGGITIEGLSEVDLIVSLVLLVAGTGVGEEGVEGCY
jgi:hypothetical protein